MDKIWWKENSLLDKWMPLICKKKPKTYERRWFWIWPEGGRYVTLAAEHGCADPLSWCPADWAQYCFSWNEIVVSTNAGGEIKNTQGRMGMVVHVCSPSPWEVPEGGSRSSTATEQIRDQPGLHEVQFQERNIGWGCATHHSCLHTAVTRHDGPDL